MRLFQFCFSQLRSSGDKHTLKRFVIILICLQRMQAGYRSKAFIPSSISFVSFALRIGLRT